ncbi:DUF7619 domain-containing protein [Culicoidibacter larvae]|uniref:DUF11 domain-containing protein n=1 Tax=Culicoidibacter larvae TaxID=2579976 RepID=A0A5R8QAS3_9FIRM|nr:InlB B-repeat-containing protein [Culicoidibacter larvae]TLG72725.1 DUF11 domain-containing protein [Culicoidibacter larvae]
MKKIGNLAWKLFAVAITLALMIPNNIVQAAAPDSEPEAETQAVALGAGMNYDAPSYGQISAVKFVEVVNGYLGGAAVDSNGSVWSWGYNAYGQTGVDKYADGTTVAMNAAVNGYLGGMRRVEYFVDNNIKVVSVQGNYHNRVALDDQGNVYTWGHGGYGQMGNGTTTLNNRQPVKVAGLPKIKQILSSNGEIMGFNYAIDVDGNIWGWGYNANGQLGNGTTSTSQTTPVKFNVPAGITFVDMTAGDNQFHAVDQNGDIWSAGYQYQGRLGNGRTTGNSSTPAKMTKPAGMGKIIDISSSYGMNVALDADGKVWQWGAIYGVSGGTAGVSVTSTPIQLEIDAAEVAAYGYTPVAKSVWAGESVSYFIDQYGRSWAWGSNRYFALGREGGYETNNDIMLAKAQQWPKIIGDGDTQIYDSSTKNPAAGLRPSGRGGYGFNDLHPTIYDEKYNDPKEDVWKNLAFKDVPYVKQVVASRSAYTLLDEYGNIYKWGNDGSGSVAWGWDYQPQYDQNGDTRRGLYDRYLYEVMYMRGAPTVDPITLSLDYSPQKVYLTEDNTTQNKITVAAKLPAAFDDPNMNITISSELQEVRYVVVPYDTSNADFNINSVDLTKAKFEELYANSAYRTGSLVDAPIDGGASGKTWTGEIDVTENSRVYVMAVDRAYGKVSETFQAYTADNFYTPTTLKHNGVGQWDDGTRLFGRDLGEGISTLAAKEVELYAATTDNVVKSNIDGVSTTVYGLPLDANGAVIIAPSMGYDEVAISKYEELPNGEQPYWNFKTGQTSPITYTLNNVDYVASESYVHTFFYERNLENWVSLTYDSELLSTGDPIDGFSMSESDLLKKNIEITRTVPTFEDYTLIGYKVDGGAMVPMTGDTFVYTPTADANITFVYQEAEPDLSGTKIVVDEDGDDVASAGETLSYTISYTNNGVGKSYETVIRDALDDTEFAGSTITNVKVNGVANSGDIKAGINVGTVAPGATVSVSFDVTLASPLPAGDGILKNIAVSTDRDGNEKEVEKEVPTDATPDLVGTKSVVEPSGDGKANAGETLEYTITYINNGNLTAKDVIVKDTLSDSEFGGSTVSDLQVNAVPNAGNIKAGINVGDLAPGASVTVTFKVTLASPLPNGDGLLKNIATANGEETETEIPTDAAPNLVGNKDVVEPSGDGKANAGETLSYTITYTNNGNLAAKDVVIKDTLADDEFAGSTVTNVKVNGVDNAGDIKAGINVGDLAAGASVSVTFDVTLANPLPAGDGVLKNIATANGTETEKEIPTDAAPNLSGTKVVTEPSGDGKANAGETLSYTITYTNNGNLTAKDVEVKDTLADTEFAGSTITNLKVNGADNAGNIKTGINVGDLAAGASVTITFDVTLANPLPAGDGVLKNIATAGGTSTETEVPTDAAPILNGSKTVTEPSGDGKANAGETLQYTITYTNTGNLAASDVIVQDALNDTEFVGSTITDLKVNGVTASGNIKTGINVGAIEPGATISVTFSVTLANPLPAGDGVLKNIATANGEETETEIPTDAAPNLVGTKNVVEPSGDGKANAGETLSYTLTFTNTGNLVAKDVIVQDALDDAEFAGSTVKNLKVDGSAVWFGDIKAGVNVGDIAVGATVTVTFDVELANPLPSGDGVLKNIATAGGEEVEKEIPTDAAPDLAGTKTVVEPSGDGKANAGETLSYTITYINNGNLLAKDVIVKDTLADTEFAGSVVSNVQVNGVANSGNVKTGINVGDLAAGASVSVTFDVTLASPLPAGDGVLRNIATANGIETETEIPTDAAPNLAGTKAVTEASGDGKANAGETLSYTITYVNNGNLKATDVIVKDELSDDEFAGSTVSNLKVNGVVNAGDIKAGIHIGELAVGASVSVTFDVTLADPLPAGDGVLKNIATANGTETETEIPTDAAPDLVGNKAVTEPSGDGKANAGETLSYTITYTNNGNIDAENVIVKDELADTEFAGSTVSNLAVDGTANAGDIKAGINVGTIAPGATVSVTFDVTLANPLPAGDGVLKNIATANGNETETEIPTEAAPHLVGAKSVADENSDGKANAGETLSYTITYVNNGNLKATDVIVKDALADTEFAGSTVSNLKVNGVTNNGNIKTGINVGDLAVGATVTVTFDVTLASPLPAGDGVLKNIATANGEETETEIPTDAAPHLVGTKSVVEPSGDGKANAGETLSYTITYVNNGNLKATDVMIGDALDDTEFAGSTITNLKVNGVDTAGDITSGINVGELNPGASVSVTFDVTLANPLPAGDGVLKNIATANGEETETEIPTDAAPDLAGTKSVVEPSGDGKANAGETLSYTITYINNGNLTAENVVIRDLLRDTEFAGSTITNVMVNGIAHSGDIIAGINVGDLAPGASVSVTFDLTLADPLPAGDGVLKNIATAGGTSTETEVPTDAAPYVQNNKSVVEPSGDGKANAGEKLSYTLTYTNTGNLVSGEVIAKDTLSDDEFAGSVVTNLQVDGVSVAGDIKTGINLGALEPGDTVTVTFDVTLANPLPAGDGVLKNIATGGDNEPEIEIPTDAAPDLVGTKSVVEPSGDGKANAGETLSYTISFVNNGSLAAKDVVVKDELSDTEFAGSTVTNLMVDGVAHSGDIKAGIAVGDLAAGATVTVTFDVTLANPLPAGDGVLSNIATAGGAEVEKEIPTDAAPDLVGTKSVVEPSGDGKANAGETLSYTITYVNNGNVKAENVTVKDALSDTEFAGSTVTNLKVNGADNAGNIKTGINVGELAAGATVVVTFDVTLANPLPAGDGVLKNIATANGNETETEIPTDAAPDLAGTKTVVEPSGDGKANAGETLSYTINFVNNGNLAATDVIVKDELLDTEFAGSTIANVKVNGIDNSGDIKTGINVGTLAPGANVIVTFEVTLADPLPAGDGVLRNIATANGEDTTTEIPTDAAPNLSGTKVVVEPSGDGKANAGETLSYTITYTNDGNLTAKDVIVKDTLSDTEFVGSTITNLKVDGVANAGDITLGINTGDLAAGATVTVTFDVTLASPLPAGDGVLKNIATANGEETETEIPTDAAPNLTGTKSVVEPSGDGKANAGETLSYTITYTNNGNLKATDVIVQDALADDEFAGSTVTNLKVNGVDTAGDIQSGINVGELIPGASVTITFDVTLADPLPAGDGVLNNIATANGEEIETEIPTDGAPELSGAKTVVEPSGDGKANAGETLAYTITYTNAGNLKAENVVVKDALADSEFAGSTVANVKVNGVANAGNIKTGINVGELEPGATVTVTFDVTLANPLPAGDGVLKNIATANGNETETEIPTDAAPVLTGTKSVVEPSGDGKANAGETLSYTITYTNSGNLKAENFTISDALDDSEFAGSTVSNLKVDGVANAGDIKTGIVIAELAPSAVVTITFDVTLANPLPAGDGVLKNIATAGDGTETEKEIPTDSTPDLVGTKDVVEPSGDGKAGAGETLSYTITYTNNGGVKAENVVIKDELADTEFAGSTIANLKVDGVDSNGSIQSGINIGELAPGASVTITFDVTLADPLPNGDGVLKNIATAGDGTETEKEIPTDAAPYVQNTKSVVEPSGDGKANAGETLTYTLTYTNTGNLKSAEVIAKDALTDTEFAGSTVTNLQVDGVAHSGDIKAGISIGELAPGTSVVVTFDVTLANPLPAGDGVLKNIATGGDNEPEIEIPTDAAPNLVGSKSVVEPSGDGKANAGETLAYTITYTNNGNLAAQDVVVKDELADTEFAGSTITNLLVDGVANSGNIKTGINVGDLAAGATVTVTFDVTLANPLPAGDGVLKNIATAGDKETETEIPTDAAPILSGTKAVVEPSGDGKANAGETLEYTITYTNTGNLVAKDVVIKDELADTEFAGSSVGNLQVDGIPNSGDIKAGINVGDLNPGASVSVVFYVTLADPLPAGNGMLKNIATAGDGTETETQIPTDAAPKLDGTKAVVEPSGDGKANAGETLSYTITYTNNGSLKAEDVIVKDELADTEFAGSVVSNLMVDGAAHAGDIKAGINVGELAPGATVTVTFDVTLANPLPAGDGVLKNIATANGNETETEIPTDAAPNLVGTKDVVEPSGDGKANAGETLSYTITYTNTGALKAENVVVKDELNDTEFAGSTVTNLKVDGVANNSDIKAGINVGELAPGASVTITFDVTLASPLPNGDGVLKNIATAGDGTETEKEIPTDAAPNLVGTKSVVEPSGDGKANAGETLSYTVTYTNNGNLAATDVVITDALSDTEFAGSTVTNLKVDGVDHAGDITAGIHVGTIEPGVAVVVTFDVVLANPLPAGDGVLKNIATGGGNEPEVEIPTDGAPNLVGTKDVVEPSGDGKANAGETLSYTITYTNEGNVKATNVTIKDELSDTEFAGSIVSNLMINGAANSGSIKAGLVIAEIAVGETVTVTFDVTLANPLPAGDGVLKNIATAGDGTETEKEIPTDAAPILVGTKDVVDANGNGVADAGETLTYTITYRNNGNLAATDVIIQDELADDEFAGSTVTDLVVNGATHSGDITAGINVGTVEAGAEVIVTFNVTLSDPLPNGDGILRNIATANGEETEKEIPTDAAPRLAGTKTVVEPSGDGVANAGETLEYTITFTNEGNKDAENVIVKDELTDTEFSGSTISDLQVNGTADTGDIKAGINVGTLAPGASVTVSFKVTLADTLAVGDYVLTNIATANGFEAETEIPIERPITSKGPEYTGKKEVSEPSGDGKASAGETLTYTITYKNIGDTAGSDIIIKDELADTEFAGSTITNLQVNGVAFAGDIKAGITIASLDVDEEVVVTFDVTLATPLPAGDGTLKNIATVNDGGGTEVELPVQYQVFYDGNGHTAGEAPTDAHLYDCDALVTILGKHTLEKDGYIFVGWSMTPSQNTRAIIYNENDNFTITSDTTLYAVWAPVEIPIDPVDPVTPEPELPITGSSDTALIIGVPMILLALGLIIYKKSNPRLNNNKEK